MRGRWCMVPLLAVLAGWFAGPAAGQDARLTLGGDTPVDVIAPQGFEFFRDRQIVVARGGATAIQGDLTVRADVLAAFYREREDGVTEITRLTAEGNVEIVTDSQKAFGDRGVYDVAKQVAVLTGDDLRLLTAEDTITARESLEYWRVEKLAVARGDALAVRGDNRVRADSLVGLVTEGADGRMELTRIDALGDVVVTTPEEVARGQRGTYDLGQRFVTLTGDVRITRGRNQLNGCGAEVDLESGISRMLATPQCQKDRVRGLFVPERTARPGAETATPPPAVQPPEIAPTDAAATAGSAGAHTP